MNRKHFQINLLVVFCSLSTTMNVQAQNVTAYRGESLSQYAINEIIEASDTTAGNLADVDSLVVTGTWTSDNLLTLQKALKSIWTNAENDIENDTLKKVDMATVTLSGTMTNETGGMKNLFRKCTALLMVQLPAGTNTQVSFQGTFEACSSLKQIYNLDEFTAISDLSRICRDCASLELVRFSDTRNTQQVNFESAFYGCKTLKQVENLDKFSNINNLNATFIDCHSLTSLLFAYAKNTNAISFNETFKRCTLLRRVNNLNSFTNINNLKATFDSCSAMEVVRLNVNLNDLTTANLMGTFDNTNIACLKYFPVDKQTIPQEWINAAYSNFVLPLSIDSLTAPDTISEGQMLALAAIPTITADYCYRADTLWQTCTTKDFSSNISTFVKATAWPFSENGKYLRLAVRAVTPDAGNRDTLYVSNAVKIHIRAQEMITAYRSGIPTKYAKSNLKESTATTSGTLADADSIVITGAWTTNDFYILEKALKDRWDSFNLTPNEILQKVDMSTVKLKTESNVCFVMGHLFYNCRNLTTVILPANEFKARISFESAFSGCRNLVQVKNLEKYTNIERLSATFYDCISLDSINFASTTTATTTTNFFYAFSGCTRLKRINNLDKFTDIDNLQYAFQNCDSLESIHLGEDPNDVIANYLKGTFDGLNPNCLKYVPTRTTDIPQPWKDAGYKNFVMPLTIETLNPIRVRSYRIPTTLIPTINAVYSYRTDTIWQTCPDSLFAENITNYAVTDTLLTIEDGNYVRLAVKSINPNTDGTDIYYYSNVVPFHVITAVDIIRQDNVLYAENGRIICSQPFEIYTLSGVNVTHNNGLLSCGIYIVKTHDTAHKIIIN